MDVKICASAAICNLVLGFSATAKDIINRGGIKRIVALLYSSEIRIRCNGLWSLNNLVIINFFYNSNNNNNNIYR